jgi:4'-phosphopantetheinyl transferase
MRLVEPHQEEAASTGSGLGDGELHLWCSVPDATVPAEALERELAPEELARGRAIRLARRRGEYLLTRALVRRVLSAYAPTAPSAWRFRNGPHGRPEIDPPSRLSFNLSTCDGLVACLVGLDRQVGLDVEPADRGAEVLELAARVLAPSERRALDALATAEARHDLALTLWTLKEAYLKARGLGLSMPLQSLAFSVAPGDISLQAPPDVEAAPGQWTFASFALGRHRAAVAAGTGPGRPSLLRLRATPAWA